MNVSSRARFGAVLGAAALGLGALAAPASADPSSFTDYRILSAVGSDTTQDVMNGLANGTDVVNAGGAKIISSWNAAASQPFDTKDPATTPGCSYTRSSTNGSTNGIDRLSDDIYFGGSTCIDIARSSRGPRLPGPDLTYIPFARDALTYATDLGSTLPTNLTRLQLKDIYTNCTYTDGTGVHAVQPLLPFDGTGTWHLWLDYLRVTTPGACVDQTIQPNNGQAITAANQLMPYSVAQWISQGKGFSDVPNRRGETRLRGIDGQTATTGTGTTLAINPNYAFSRDVYNVVRSTGLNDAAIAEALVGSTSDVCRASATIQTYGFLPIANCGATTLTGGLWS